MVKIKLTESKLKALIREAIEEETGLAWETLMNAARKAHERGDDRYEKFLKASRNAFMNKHGIPTNDDAEAEKHPYMGNMLGRYDAHDIPSDYPFIENGHYQINMSDYTPNASTSMFSLYPDMGQNIRIQDMDISGDDAESNDYPYLGKPSHMGPFHSFDDVNYDKAQNQRFHSADDDMRNYYTGKSKYSPEKGWHIEGQLAESIMRKLKRNLR